MSLNTKGLSAEEETNSYMTNVKPDENWTWNPASNDNQVLNLLTIDLTFYSEPTKYSECVKSIFGIEYKGFDQP